MHDVFPKEHNFGKLYFRPIKTHLKKFMSDTIFEWETAYKYAKMLSCENPSKVEKLQEIHDQPSYYTDYYVCQFESNLLLLCSYCGPSTTKFLLQRFCVPVYFTSFYDGVTIQL